MSPIDHARVSTDNGPRPTADALRTAGCASGAHRGQPQIATALQATNREARELAERFPDAKAPQAPRYRRQRRTAATESCGQLPSPAMATMAVGDFDRVRVVKPSRACANRTRISTCAVWSSICAPAVEPVCATRCFPVDSICTF